MDIEIDNFFVTIEHQYPDFHLTMKSYKCKCKNKIVKLSEHIDFKWLTVDKIAPLDLAAADIPIVDKLIEKILSMPMMSFLSH